MDRCRTVIRKTLVWLIPLILMLISAGSTAAESDSYLGIPFHPFTLDGSNSNLRSLDGQPIRPDKKLRPG